MAEGRRLERRGAERRKTAAIAMTAARVIGRKERRRTIR